MCSNGRSIMQSVLFLQSAECWLVNRRALLPMGNQTRSLRIIAINSAFSLHEYKYTLSCGASHCVDDGNESLHSPSRLFLAVSNSQTRNIQGFFLFFLSSSFYETLFFSYFPPFISSLKKENFEKLGMRKNILITICLNCDKQTF